MPETTTITASITYPIADIETFADRRGYQEVIPNPDYVFDQDTMQGVGEPTIPNPQTRIEFVKEWFKKEAVKLFAQDIEKAAEREAREMAAQAAAQKKVAIEAAISIE